MDAQQPETDTIRVLVAEDDDAFAEITTLLLQRSQRIEVIGTARDGKEALAMADALGPDVVVMDLDMPVLGGIEATRVLSERGGARVVVLTGSDIADDIQLAREAGAAAYVPKIRIAQELVPAVVGVARGDTPLVASGGAPGSLASPDSPQ